MSLEKLRNAAEAGDRDAQLQLGIALMTGRGGPAPDVAGGRAWLARAAEAGSRNAQRFLGLIYMRGMDVVPDFVKANAYLQAAAAAGDAESHWFLACFIGGARDDAFAPEAALSHLRTAAEAGHHRAMAHLGYALWHGFLAPCSPREALGWTIRAANQGDPGALLALAEHCAVGCLLPRNPARARALAQTAAEAGWEVAGEYAASLDPVLGEADAWRSLVPTPEELDPKHSGSLPHAELEVVSWQPRVLAFRHFLSNFECAEIANAAAEHLMPSFIVDGEGQLGRHQIRTSHEVRLRPGIRNIVINAVERRMADWSQFPLENGELPLVLHYEHSQSFEQHYDYFIPEKFVMGEGPLAFGGQRIATQLVYLNEDFEGGETRFDRTGLVLQPERGMCALFHNVRPDHNVDPLTRHTGVAVSRGVKWLLSRWVREIPFDRPASDLVRDRYREA